MHYHCKGHGCCHTCIFILLFTDPPSAPEGPLQISNVTLNSADLSWKPPKSDGGSKLTKYVIEMRDARRTYWNKVEEVKPSMTSYTVSNLTTDNEYVFRVIAVNDEGQSPPLTSDKSAKPKRELSKSLIITTNID